MKELASPAIVGFIAGAVGAMLVAWLGAAGEMPDLPVSKEEDAIVELQARVALLEDQLSTRPQTLSAQPQASSLVEPNMAENPASAGADSQETERSSENRMANYLRKKRERTNNQLRAAGWSDAEIQSLDELKMAASLEIEERLYEQMRKAVDEYPWAMGFGGSHHLRDSLGDERYEQYLAATGRQTAMKVSTILRGSAGDAAGLQEGDRIRRYGNDRVYNEQDLMMSVLRGEPGEAVSIEVERDGAIFHVTVPRGPLGTSQMAGMIVDN